ncbi:hypothetical protein CBD81_002325 [bacterium TMED221]|jgi:hypothetical protein|nr:MAG: hypothetical protein CBD81_002325 [bacterium TMED221]|tara:strand:+ start:170 stop:820 length:651 start_codon:yes stop_codon:yes gene_type:complete
MKKILLISFIVLLSPLQVMALPGLDDLKSMNPLGGGDSDVDLAGGKTQLLAKFDQSSKHFMLAQEILLRAVGKNTEADIVKAGIEYSKNSKNSEADRIANSIKVTTQASKALESVDSLKSGGLSAEGKVLYVKSFPSAIKGLKATIQLVPVSKTMVAGVSANPMSAFKELGGVAKIIPKIPGYISNVTSVMGLIISGAQANDIEGTEDLQASLGEL